MFDLFDYSFFDEIITDCDDTVVILVCYEPIDLEINYFTIIISLFQFHN